LHNLDPLQILAFGLGGLRKILHSLRGATGGERGRGVLVIEIRHVDSRSRVVAVCDSCARVIEGADEGNYEWGERADNGRPTTPVYFAHKRCSAALEAALCPSGDLWATSELSLFPIRLEPV